MKKIAFLFTLLFFVGHFSNAQSNFRFGFQLSPNFTWLANTTSNNTISGNGANLGIHLGVMGEQFFTEEERYAVTLGIGFAFNQGGTLKYSTGAAQSDLWPNSFGGEDPRRALPDGVNLKYGIQYIHIPVGFKMRTQEFGFLRYYVEPNMHLSIRTQARGDISSAGELNVEDINVRKDVSFLNIGWGIGAGAEYSIAERNLIIGGIEFNNGFVDVTGDDGKLTRADGSVEKETSRALLRSITIKLGLMF